MCVCVLCVSKVCLLCIIRRVSSADRTILWQSPVVSLLRAALLWLLSPWRHHHHPVTHGAQLGPDETRGGCSSLGSLVFYRHVEVGSINTLLLYTICILREHLFFWHLLTFPPLRWNGIKDINGQRGIETLLAWIFLFSQFGVQTESEFCPVSPSVTHTQLQHVLYLSSVTCVYPSRCLRRPCTCWLRWGRSLCWTWSSWTLSWWRIQSPCLRPTACGRGSVCWATTCSPAAAEPARNSKPGVCVCVHVCV